MASGTDEPSVRSQGIKIGLIVVLLAAAGLIAYTQARSDLEQPDTPDTATTYVCVECNHGFDLTPAKYVALCESGGFQVGEGHLRGTGFLRCPECQKFGGVKGTRCPKHGTPIPRITKDGRPGRCSKCGSSSAGG
jgi:hypothetical protein